MVKREIKSEYIDSYLGIFWVFFRPMVQILVMYFAFVYGLKIKTEINSTPFIIFLIVGIVSWNFISELLGASPLIFRNFGFLIKKSNFNLLLLPLVKFLSSFTIHLMVLLLVSIILGFHGYLPSISTFILFYYIIYLFTFFYGLSLLLSSLSIFIPDIPKIVNILITFGFWVTPIMWSTQSLSGYLTIITSLNPATFIVEGYRNSLYLKLTSSETFYMSLYYWFLVFFINILGFVTFKRLRPHFAEVI